MPHNLQNPRNSVDFIKSLVSDISNRFPLMANNATENTGKQRRTFRVVGVDLAGSPGRNTGICLLRGKTVASYATVYSDEDIIRFIDQSRPHLIAIDAPLSLPPGRKTMEDRNAEHLRPCDRELLKRGIPFFPITLGPMRLLTKRGIRLKKMLTARKYSVIEIYPGAAQDILGIPRKQQGLAKLRKGLERTGLRGLTRDMNGDELDAVTGALVGRMYLAGKAEALGDFKTGAIIVPAASAAPRAVKKK